MEKIDVIELLNYVTICLLHGATKLKIDCLCNCFKGKARRSTGDPIESELRG